MIYVLFRNVGVEILAFDEAKEELVDDLNMGPGHFQHRFVFLWIKGLALRVHGGWNRSKQIFTEHVDDSRIHWLRDDLAIVCHIVKQLVQCQAFDLFGLHVPAGIIEVEDDVALVNLLHKQFLSSVWGNLVKSR